MYENINMLVKKIKLNRQKKQDPSNKCLQLVLNNVVNTFSIFKKAEKNKSGKYEIILFDGSRITYSYKSLVKAISIFKKFDQNSYFLKGFINLLEFNKLSNKEQEKILPLLSAVKLITLLTQNYICKKDDIKNNYKAQEIFQLMIDYEIGKYCKNNELKFDNVKLNEYLSGKHKNDFKLIIESIPEISKYNNLTNWKIAFSLYNYCYNLFKLEYINFFDEEIKNFDDFIKNILEYGFIKYEYDLFLLDKKQLKNSIFDFIDYNQVSHLLLIISDYLKNAIKNDSQKAILILREITETGGKIRLSDDPPMNWYQWTNLFGRYVFLIFWCVVVIYPIFIFVKQAFNGLNGSQVSWTQFSFSTRSFHLLFTDSPYLHSLGISLIISVSTMILTTFFAGLTSYAFSRFRFKGKHGYFSTFLILQLIPTFTGVIVYYVFVTVLEKLGFPSYIALIIIYTGGGIVGNTLIIKSYMDSISHEIDDAAIIDGCGYIRIYFKIIFPLSLPILTLVALWSFTGPFSDVIIPNIVIFNQSDYTVALLLFYWISPPSSNPEMVNFSHYIDGGLLIAVPIAIVFLILQKYVVEGMLLGGVKG